MKRKEGDYIFLHWGDYGPHPYYIKGHVSIEDAAKVLLFEQEVAPAKIAHKYGRSIRIGRDHEDCFDGCESTFRVIDNPRKSYYPVTECWAKEQHGN